MSEVLKRELEKIKKQERKFLENNENKSDNFLNKKLSEVVPEGLHETLNTAFFKAFSLVFEKGTGIIEKTYNKDELKREFAENIQISDYEQSGKSIKEISKKAKAAGSKNMLVSGAAGIGMGVLGAGIPDVPVFSGMILKNIYEIGLNYGFDYDSDMEKFFVLLLIEGAVSYGSRLRVVNKMIDAYVEGRAVPGEYIREGQMKKTANALSKELLYMKFLQGIPVVGLVGGVQDAVCMRKITAYAELKYRKRVIYKMKDWWN